MKVIRRHQLISFFVLAYALTWPLIPLVSVSPLLGLPALLGPALAAIMVAAVVDGGPGLLQHRGRCLVALARRPVGARALRRLDPLLHAQDAPEVLIQAPAT